MLPCDRIIVFTRTRTPEAIAELAPTTGCEDKVPLLHGSEVGVTSRVRARGGAGGRVVRKATVAQRMDTAMAPSTASA